MASLANLEERGAPRRVAVRLASGLAVVAMLAMIPAASPQDANEFSTTLAEGVRCDDANALTDLSANLAKAPAAAAEMVTTALAALAGDDAICGPVRSAALSLVADPGTLAGVEPAAPDPARSLVEATLAEADRRAAAMKFEVGPPPLNLSRGRRGGS